MGDSEAQRPVAVTWWLGRSTRREMGLWEICLARDEKWKRSAVANSPGSLGGATVAGLGSTVGAAMTGPGWWRRGYKEVKEQT